RARQSLTEAALGAAQARHWRLVQVDPVAAPPDPRLLDAAGAAACLRDGLLPWRRVGGTVVVLTAAPDAAGRSAALLRAAFGTYVLALATPAAMAEALLALRGAALRQGAETRVPAAESCRHWGRGTGVTWALAAGAAGALLFWAAPVAALVLLALWTLLTLAAVTGLKAAALWATRAAPAAPVLPVPDALPVISVIVALYREGAVAERLVRRLERLAYPRDRLDIVLAVEEEDALTRRALERACLPAWMRVVVAPDGPIRTKPRALNLALDQCRGSIIGVYDAEDAPDPGQLHAVAAQFAAEGPQVACLQGVLDFYNPHTNWLSRCFTMEYAAWFRVLLPGLARLGVPLPLGGTTLFFRRAALEQLGGWDAHNVTEDADLGIRLARHGFVTRILDSVTWEEANCRAIPWVRQRSRWLKGYMMTWAVHMRDPALLWRQLGPRGFLGFQVLFLGTLTQFLLAPVLWSFWLVPMGLPHPVADALPASLIWAMAALYLVTEAVNLTAGWVGLRRRGGGLSPAWLPTLHVYFPLGALASYKAAAELVRNPFYWDKTSHGMHDAPALLSAPNGPQAAEARPDQRVRISPASMRRRVSNALEMWLRSA
ncbi:MAG TPA: glycosyltransferase, partial [Paracoccaceae bacterium]|nr:glycosyltransferase [Paracoccaceae bacterium]